MRISTAIVVAAVLCLFVLGPPWFRKACLAIAVLAIVGIVVVNMRPVWLFGEPQAVHYTIPPYCPPEQIDPTGFCARFRGKQGG
jgi:hypothetical protein